MSELVFPLRVTVRAAEERDLAPLEWYGHQANLRAHFRELLARAATGDVLVLVAEANGYPVGRLAIDFARRPETAYMWSFAVIAHLQRLGIGTFLIATAERVARERGASRVELHVEIWHDEGRGARRLYERLGYRAAGRDGPELVMEKEVG